MIQQFHYLGLQIRELKTFTHKNLYVNVHSTITDNRQKGETTQMSINWWMGQQKVVYSHRIILLAMKKVLIHATTWMNLEDIMLSESSQSQKTTCCLIPFS